MGLYESMKAERAHFTTKESDYEDRFNKIGVEVEAKAASELTLLDDNKALKIRRDKASQRMEVEKRRAKEERARAEEERAQAVEAINKVDEVNMSSN